MFNKPSYNTFQHGEPTSMMRSAAHDIAALMSAYEFGRGQ